MRLKNGSAKKLFVERERERERELWMDLGGICGFRFLCAAKIDLLILIENLREEECWLLGLCFSDKIF